MYGLFEFYFVSDRWARKKGAFGCLFGLAFSFFYTLYDFLMGLVVFFDRLFLGCANGWCCLDYDYVLDPSWKTAVYPTTVVASEVEAFLTQGIPKARKAELGQALDFTVRARMVYERAKPSLSDGHRHFVSVGMMEILAVLRQPATKKALGFGDSDVDEVRRRLQEIADAIPAGVQHSLVRQRADSVGAQRLLESAEFAVVDGTEEPSSNSDSQRAAYRRRLREKVARRVPSNGKPGKATVSFSSFLQALQPVYRRLCIQENSVTRQTYRRSVLKRATGQSQYLN